MKEILSSLAARLASAKKRYLIGGVILLSLAFNAASDTADYMKAVLDLLLGTRESIRQSIEGPPRGDGKSFPPSIAPDDIYIAKQ